MLTFMAHGWLVIIVAVHSQAIRFLLLQSKVYIETAIQMALQPPQVYHLMQKMFLMFEEGGLKGQKKTNFFSEICRKKALQGQYSPKAHHFKLFQGLQVYTCWEVGGKGARHVVDCCV